MTTSEIKSAFSQFCSGDTAASIERLLLVTMLLEAMQNSTIVRKPEPDAAAELVRLIGVACPKCGGYVSGDNVMCASHVCKCGWTPPTSGMSESSFHEEEKHALVNQIRAAMRGEAVQAADFQVVKDLKDHLFTTHTHLESTIKSLREEANRLRTEADQLPNYKEMEKRIDFLHQRGVAAGLKGPTIGAMWDELCNYLPQNQRGWRLPQRGDTVRLVRLPNDMAIAPHYLQSSHKVVDWFMKKEDPRLHLRCEHNFSAPLDCFEFVMAENVPVPSNTIAIKGLMRELFRGKAKPWNMNLRHGPGPSK